MCGLFRRGCSRSSKMSCPSSWPSRRGSCRTPLPWRSRTCWSSTSHAETSPRYSTSRRSRNWRTGERERECYTDGGERRECATLMVVRESVLRWWWWERVCFADGGERECALLMVVRESVLCWWWWERVCFADGAERQCAMLMVVRRES